MKKLFTFNKEEKVVLITGIIIIVLIIVGGVLKSKFIKEEPYVPKDLSSSEVADEFSLKQETFTIQAGEKISKSASKYVTANSDDLKKVKMDLSKVDTTTPGTYKATAKLDKETLSFTVEVVESVNPVFKVAHENFQFIIEASSTMEEVKTYAGVTATDAKGNDITANITGWKETLPAEASTVVYDLSVADADGKKSEQKITVQYLMPKQDTAAN